MHAPAATIVAHQRDYTVNNLGLIAVLIGRGMHANRCVSGSRPWMSDAGDFSTPGREQLPSPPAVCGTVAPGCSANARDASTRDGANLAWAIAQTQGGRDITVTVGVDTLTIEGERKLDEEERAEVPAGVTGVLSPMGDYSESMTVRQLLDLIAYLQSANQ